MILLKPTGFCWHNSSILLCVLFLDVALEFKAVWAIEEWTFGVEACLAGKPLPCMTTGDRDTPNSYPGLFYCCFIIFIFRSCPFLRTTLVPLMGWFCTWKIDTAWEEFALSISLLECWGVGPADGSVVLLIMISSGTTFFKFRLERIGELDFLLSIVRVGYVAPVLKPINFSWDK